MWKHFIGDPADDVIVYNVMCIIHHRTRGYVMMTSFCACVRVEYDIAHFWAKTPRVCKDVSIKSTAVQSLSRWKPFSPVANSAGAMGRFACRSTSTSTFKNGLRPPFPLLQCGSAVCFTFISALVTLSVWTGVTEPPEFSAGCVPWSRWLPFLGCWSPLISPVVVTSALIPNMFLMLLCQPFEFFF